MKTQSDINQSFTSVHIQWCVSSMRATLHIMPACYITSKQMSCRCLFNRIGTLAASITHCTLKTSTFCFKQRLQEKNKNPAFTQTQINYFHFVTKHKKTPPKTPFICCTYVKRRCFVAILPFWIFRKANLKLLFSILMEFFHRQHSYIGVQKLSVLDVCLCSAQQLFAHKGKDNVWTFGAALMLTSC